MSYVFAKTLYRVISPWPCSATITGTATVTPAVSSHLWYASINMLAGTPVVYLAYTFPAWVVSASTPFGSYLNNVRFSYTLPADIAGALNAYVYRLNLPADGAAISASVLGSTGALPTTAGTYARVSYVSSNSWQNVYQLVFYTTADAVKSIHLHNIRLSYQLRI